MPKVITKHLEIYFEKTPPKSNGPLLFIGGTDGDLRNKPNQLNSPLADHFEIISYDQRGLGQTSCPPGDFTMENYADDAKDLLDLLSIDHIPVVGVSFGGMVAQELAIRHPKKISKLVLCCTSSGGEGGSSYPLHELQHLDPADRTRLGLKLRDTRITDDWIKKNNPFETDSQEQDVEGKKFHADRSRLIKQLSARKNHDTFSRLALIDHPVLLAGGKYDGIAPPKNMRVLHKRIRSSLLHFFSGGHAFLSQDKRAYEIITDWLLDDL